MAMEKPDAQQPPPPKFSRYRSVRKAASKGPDVVSRPPPPPPLDVSVQQTPAPTAAPVKRTMSRYRRQRAPTDATAPQPPMPGDRALAYRGAAATQGKESSGSAGRDQGERPRERERDRDRRRRDVSMPVEKLAYVEDSEDEDVRDLHRQNAMDRLTGGESERERERPARRRPTTRDRAATVTRDREVKHSEERQYRTDGENHTRATSRRRSSHEPSRRHSLRESAKGVGASASSRPEEGPQPIDTSAGNRHPGFDAPVSAVNAGERQVVVRYRKTSMRLVVTPATSAQDLLFTAGECLAGDIDPVKFILMESFSELGLERPLRRYESVREVMNSWAHDRENTLIIVPAASLEALSLLDAHCVPAAQPADVTLHMYYSQRPRKWDKRFITLRSDGQVTQSKKESGQESANICHLSDFDIYSPTPGYLSNNIKPPKKICQAVKSQQKSSMFLSTENFVHFFCTNDKATADAWHRAVHGWRSWYLVNMLGAGESKIESPAVEESPVTKPFKPLLSMDSPETSGCEGALDRTRSSKSKELFSRKKHTREHAPPPSSFPKTLADDPDLTSPASSSDDSPFTSSGLLGRNYTLRHRAMKEREEREKKAVEDPFAAQGLIGTMTRRPTGPSSRPTSRSNTMTSQAAPDLSGLKRSGSTKTKPLVDLTPVYQEPPQHTRKKGRGVAVEPGTLLIDAATAPLKQTSNIAVPAATTWRRPPPPPIPTAPPLDMSSSAELPPRTRNRSNTARSHSANHPHVQPRHYNSSTPTSPTAAISPVEAAAREDPFIPNSLISRSVQLAALQNNGVPVGHGVATGDRMATKPMLDMEAENPFTQGSLLRGL